jgi:hypothetical protein
MKNFLFGVLFTVVVIFLAAFFFALESPQK